MDLDYDTVVGLEVHVQLATATKLFSSATCAFGRPANIQVDPVSLGLPGSLPVVNARAVDLAVLAALALGGEIHRRSRFARKHFFYPDMPKNYQISQYDEPYCTGGAVTIDLPSGEKRIPLTRIHMEEDAGKLVHQEAGPWSEVDLNRSGTPLIEIVSQPDLRSGQEAHAYLVEIRRILTYCGVSDCEMQEGSLRCDANVSIRRHGEDLLGTKVEIKNLNSLRAVEAAIEYEAREQIALAHAGRYAAVVQETKLWDPDSRSTRSMRGKEGAADYRYFPDPDLPPLTLDEARVEELRHSLVELPRARQSRFERSYGFAPSLAGELTAERPTADYFECLLGQGVDPQAAANWTREEALRLAAAKRMPIHDAAPLPTMAALIGLVESGAVARVVAKGSCDHLFASGETPERFFASRGMIQDRDPTRTGDWVLRVLTENPKAVADIRAGRLAAAGRLVGCAMKLSGGKADPRHLKAEIARQLEIDIP